MKRDMDLLRLLLLRLETISENDGVDTWEYTKDDIGLESFEWDQVVYHYGLACEAGLVASGGNGQIGRILVRRLTWAGHDFVDAVRDDEIWRRTRQSATAAGGFSVDLLKDLAKGFIRKKISEHTGIEI